MEFKNVKVEVIQFSPFLYKVDQYLQCSTWWIGSGLESINLCVRMADIL